MSDKTGWPTSYTLIKPSGDWTKVGYDDSKWTKGEGAFGSVNRKPMVHTIWDGPELRVRRIFDLDRDLAGN